MNQVTFNEFSNAVTFNGYPAPTELQHHFCVAYGETYGEIFTKTEAAMFLAHLIYESEGLRMKHGRGNPDPEDLYYGRGYFKLVGYEMYKEASLDLYDNHTFCRNPDWVADNDVISWKTSFWFWRKYVKGVEPEVSGGNFEASTKAFINQLTEIKEEHPPVRQRWSLRLFRILGKAFGSDGEVAASTKSNLHEIQEEHPQVRRRFQIYGNVRKAFGLDSGLGAWGSTCILKIFSPVKFYANKYWKLQN